MKLFRKVIFWCHLVAGVAAGLVILLMCVTGVLLTYERQLIYWADTRGYQVQPPSPAAERLGVESLLAGAQAARPGATAVTLRADSSAPAEVAFGREGTLFVNPYTGAVLGGGSPGVRAFFRSVTDWHRWLGASGEGAGRGVGRAVTGASNLVFLFIVVSGFYLWWPRKFKKSIVRNVTWFRRGLASRARNFNWHNVIGFWSAVPLFIIVLSGVVISYPWAGNLVYSVFGEAPPAQRVAPQQGGGAERRGAGRPEENGTAGMDRLWARAEQQQPGWRSISLRLPAAAEATATFTIDLGNGGQPQKRSQLTLDRTTGEVVRWEPYSSLTPGRRARSWLRFAHTGEVAGVIGQTVAGLVTAGGAVLVWTGLALAWRRFRLSRASWAKNRPPAGAPGAGEEDYRGGAH